MSSIREIGNDLILYLKQNYPGGASFYCSTPEKFAKVKKEKKAPEPKIFVEPPLPPAPKKGAFEIQKEEVEKQGFSSELRSFYEKMAFQVQEKPKRVVLYSHPKLGPIQDLLKNLSAAINAKCCPCSVVEVGTPIDADFILIPKELVGDCPKLDKDSMVLHGLTEMETSPTMKKALWQEITQKLKR